MNTMELVTAVRDTTLEYDKTPFSDQYIIDRLNEPYRYIYNAYVKSQDTLFAQEHVLSITANNSCYDLPENLWNKRVEALWVPTPPYQSQSPWGWEKIPKVDYLQSHRYQSSKVRVYYPEVWSQLNNKIYLFPLPMISFDAKLIISRRLPPMGIFGGRIIAMAGDTFTVETVLDDNGVAIFNDPRIAANANGDNTGYISICDFTTGEIKALYHYTTAVASTGVITCATKPAARTNYMNYPISAPPGGSFGTIELDDIVCWGYNTGESLFGEMFDNLLVNWAADKIRGVLNESDPAVLRNLTAQITELRGDTGGRPMGIKKQTTAFTQYKVSRPMGR